MDAISRVLLSASVCGPAGPRLGGHPCAAFKPTVIGYAAVTLSTIGNYGKPTEPRFATDEMQKAPQRRGLVWFVVTLKILRADFSSDRARGLRVTLLSSHRDDGLNIGLPALE